MIRMLAAFLTVFSVLSLIVGLHEMTAIFGGTAALLFALDFASTYLLKAPRTVRLRGPIL
ncbi:MAG TPA: hypothetical protein VGS05_17535 [Candidatus Sulfotelmatobacter sp.]|nr:hypothetical protein [Candidatus Sulfotelmatobacter sp.]